jgi:hypothetical protein
VSKIDESVFYREGCIFVLYSILAGPDPVVLDKVILDMKEAGLNLTVEGDITDFLGVQINRTEGGAF